MNPKLVNAFIEYFGDGNRFGTIAQARQFAAQKIGQPVSPGSALAKSLDESLEAALTRVARNLAENAPSPEAGFDALIDLYERQPRLAVRSSTSIRQQAYSTPIPIAYLASTVAGITRDRSVYEPTAGHGALILAATPSLTYANELNPERAADLREQGFKVTEQDATTYLPPEQVDVVIANPPFGRVGSQSWQVGAGLATRPYHTTQIDHAIAFKSLEAMKDDGNAVLILASPLANKLGDTAAASSSYNGSQNRAFYKSLYDNYRVIDHLCIAGNLYARQGTTFPIDIIVIQGRGLSPRELPAVDLPQVYTQFSELKELIRNVSRTTLQLESTGLDLELHQRSVLQLPTHQSASGLLESPGSSSGVDDLPGTTSNLGNSDSHSTQRSPAIPDSDSLIRGGSDSLGTDADDRESGVSGTPDVLVSRGENTPGFPLGGSSYIGSNQNSDSRNRPGRMAPGNDLQFQGVGLIMADQNIPLESTEIKQVPYRPQSQGTPVGTLVPVNMRTAISGALQTLEQQTGLLDEYVARSLGIESHDRLHRQFSGEQIDALALAFASLSKGESFIIGDQTGIGKGRVVAGVIEYARRLELIPIFVTQDPKLYGDIMRDLHDIGVTDLKPIATNNSLDVPLPDGTRLRTGTAQTHRRLLQEYTAAQDLGEYDAVFTTYSQMQTVKGEETERRAFLRSIAPLSILILDESHNAVGSLQEFDNSSVPNRADFVRDLVKCSAGVIYSSATYAKNPYAMTLYSARTGMRHAVDRSESLVAMIQSGGIPLQQILAAKLTESGQYIRRERSYEGIEFAAKVAPVDQVIAENLAACMRQIMQFDLAKRQAVKGLDKELKREAKRLTPDQSTGEAGARSTNFTAIMHNVISQSLLAMKAEATVQEALAALTQGEKPVITVSNTMGSLIAQAAADQNLEPGDPIDLSAGDLLRRYLERSREVLLKDYDGKIERYRLTDADLAGEALDLYHNTQTLINETNWNSLPISPIDYIRYRLTQEGYRVNEITGRTDRIEYGANGVQLYQNRNRGEQGSAAAIRYVGAFNAGDLDVLILNRSGSTGISLHASEKFVDQRPRRMIIAQPELNIDQFMQMLGRIHRTGQVTNPSFTVLMGDIPAEKRPAAVLLKKMASLNANTTASRESGFTLDQTTDFLNAYGDQVVLEVMANRPSLHAKLGYPISGLNDDADLDMISTEGLASKITGQIPLLPIAEQEEVYNLIERQYRDLVEQEQALGQNILEAEFLDLDARTLARVEVFPAKGSERNPFTEPVYLEVLDVKAQRKPMTTLEVVNAVRQSLGLGDVSNIPEHHRDQVAELAQQQVTQQLSNLREHSLAYQLNDQLSRSLEDKDYAAKVQRLAQKSEAQYNKIALIMQEFPVGQTFWMVNRKNLSGHYGVIAGYSNTSDQANPTVPSNWKVQILLADSMRKLIVPLSQVNSSPDQGIRLSSIEAMLVGKKDVYALFDERQSFAREVRQVFTGNVLRAYEKFQGKLVHFSDHQGNVRPGLLMPESFEIDKQMALQPVVMPSAAQAIAYMQAYQAEIKTLDERLSIQPVPNQDGNLFILKTFPTRLAGEALFLDTDFLELLGTEFYSVSDRMEATATANNLEPALQYLMDKGISLAAHSDREQAREFLGIVLPKVSNLDLSTPVEAPIESSEMELETPQSHVTPVQVELEITDSVTPEIQSWVQWRDQLVRECLIPTPYVDALHQVGLITDVGFGQRSLSQMGLGEVDQQSFWFQIGKAHVERVAIADTPLDALALASIDKRAANSATVYLAPDSLESLPKQIFQQFSRQGGNLQVATGNHQQGESQAWSLAQHFPTIERLRPLGLSWIGQLLNQPHAPNHQDWPRIAQAIGHSQDYCDRIQAVIAQPLSEKAQAAFHTDNHRFSQTQDSLWNWMRAAHSVGRSPDYVQRIVAVAQAFHSDQPQPLSEQAKTAMQKDLSAQIQQARPQLAEMQISA